MQKHEPGAEADSLQREHLYRSLFEQNDDAVGLVDLHGTLIRVNSAVERLLGYSPEEMLGMGYMQACVFPEQIAESRDLLGQSFAAGGFSFDVTIRHKEGFPVDLRVKLIAAVEGDEIRGIFAVGHDITQRRRTEETVRLLAEASTVLASSLEYRNTLQELAALMVPFLADGCCIDVVEGHALRRVAVAAQDPAQASALQTLWRATGEAEQPAAGGVARCMRSGQPESVRTLTADALAALGADEPIEAYEQIGVTGYLCLPLVARERRLGALSLVRTQAGRPFTDADLATAQELARRAAVAVENAQLYHDAERAASHDVLTGLPNRARFLALLEETLQRRADDGGLAAVLFLDLDGFKVVNDSLGHHIGDELLIAAARRLQRLVGDQNVVARFGGDEFTVLLRNIGTRSNAAAKVARIVESFANSFTVGGHDVFVTPSIGVALSDQCTVAEELLRFADMAMYEAKRGGKGRHVFFDPHMNVRALERLQWEADLRRALDRQEFHVYYQPIVGLATGTIVGLEALLRWQHPTRGMVPPSDFIPLAEETGLILPIGHWVLLESCRQIRAWQLEHPTEPPLYISVNLSARQFQQIDLVQQIAGVLAETQLAAASLQLEITESVMMDDDEATLTTLRALKDLGLRLAVDDFGTGYSSLRYLKRFPVDTLKIDRTFVSGLGQSPEDTAIVRAIAAFAQAMNLGVTGEGIETVDQWESLRRLGCSVGQGYYFQRPLSRDAIASMLRSLQGRG